MNELSIFAASSHAEGLRAPVRHAGRLRGDEEG
jgi:hypothetical protein